MNTIDMENLGLGRELLAGASAVYPGLFPGRLVSQSRDLYTVVAERGELTAEVSGKFRFEAGTLNLPGIAGLKAALAYLEQRGISAIRAEVDHVVTFPVEDGTPTPVAHAESIAA